MDGDLMLDVDALAARARRAQEMAQALLAEAADDCPECMRHHFTTMDALRVYLAQFHERDHGAPPAARERAGVAAAYEAAMWEIYKLSGADTDGDEGPGALLAGMGYEGYARVVTDAVRRMREDYDECLGDDD